MKERLWYSTSIGTVFAYILSMLWSNFYALTGNLIISLIAPVNKSLFELSKGIVLPFILFAIIEYFWIKPYYKQFVSAKVFGILTIIFVQFVLYYSYVFFTDKNLIQAVILINAISLVSGFIAFSKLYISKIDLSNLFIPSLIVIGILIVSSIIFTLSPPKIDLFKDPFFNSYGKIEYYTQTRINLSDIK